MMAVQKTFEYPVFRAERYSSKALFAEDTVMVMVAGQHAALLDISDSGLAVALPRLQVVPSGLVAIAIQNKGALLYQGQACVVRQREDKEQTILGLTFLEKINCEELRLKQRLCSAIQAQQHGVPSVYKEFCYDVLGFLRQAKRACEQQFIDDEPFDPHTERAIIYNLRRFLMPEWCALMARGNSLIEAFDHDKDLLQRVKAHTELLITPEFMGAHGWQRSFLQPRGYPGDYGVMEFIYEAEPFGITFYDKLLHAFGQELGAFVRNRMQYAAQTIHDVVAAVGSERAIHITSFGSGSAREIGLFLDSYAGDASITFNLMDQDDKALAYASRQLRPRVAKRSTIRIDCHHLSIPESVAVLRRLPRQQLVYCLGVFDYLNDVQARRFIGRFHEALAEGGQMLLANLSDVPERPEWIFTNVFNWPMIYRSAEAMRGWVDGLAYSRCDLSYDATRFVHLLKVWR